MSRLARKAADVALSVAGFVVCTTGVTLALWCAAVDAPTGDDQREALAALWSTLVHLVTP